MNIMAEKVSNQWLISINGDTMTLKQFADRYNVAYGTLTVHVSKASKSGRVKEKLQEYMWKHEHKLPQQTCVVRNPLGEISCTVYVCQRVPEIPEHQARKRLRLWKQGTITTKELYETKLAMKELTRKKEEWGDLAHLSNKPKPAPKFQGTKWDRAMLGRPLHNPDPWLRRY